jgi:hypothetical protein
LAKLQMAAQRLAEAQPVAPLELPIQPQSVVRLRPAQPRMAA